MAKAFQVLFFSKYGNAKSCCMKGMAEVKPFFPFRRNGQGGHSRIYLFGFNRSNQPLQIKFLEHIINSHLFGRHLPQMDTDTFPLA